jgi:type 1 glutamine amidotransferase/nicotinamidase-related amidase
MMRITTPATVLALLTGMALLPGLLPAQPAQLETGTLTLRQRSRIETEKGSGRHHTLTKEVQWNASKTAVVLCDMWDKHWCPGATARVAEMAPRMNQVVAEARRRGALIIHCPSDTMDFYKDTPQRKLAQAAPHVQPKVPLQNWCQLDPRKEGALPIDDSDGGCAEKIKSFRAWSRQIETIRIEDGDAVTDSAEAYYLMRQRGIENVIVMGVHTNMCVLGRPFAIRQLTQQGLNVVLMRDLTDTMYNPAKAPFVSHFTGTDLVVEHIEKYWCPTVTSADLLGGKEFRFQEDKRPHLVIVTAEDEYKTEETLPEFAKKQLGKDFRVSFVFADSKVRNHLPGLEVLNDADVALISVRRRVLPKEQLQTVRNFVASGKPLVGIRTASHAFSLFPGQKLAEGLADWPDFDKEVLGATYTGHHGVTRKTTVAVAPGADKDPILAGVKGPFATASTLYRSRPLAAGTTPLLIGQAEGVKQTEPVAWTWKRQDGGRTFYTSLGHPDDFKQESFVALLRNGIHWAAGLPIGNAPRPAPARTAGWIERVAPVTAMPMICRWTSLF